MTVWVMLENANQSKDETNYCMLHAIEELSNLMSKLFGVDF